MYTHSLCPMNCLLNVYCGYMGFSRYYTTLPPEDGIAVGEKYVFLRGIGCYPTDSRLFFRALSVPNRRSIRRGAACRALSVWGMNNRARQAAPLRNPGFVSS